MTGRRIAGRALAAMLGALVGGGAVLALNAASSPTDERSSTSLSRQHASKPSPEMRVEEDGDAGDVTFHRRVRPSGRVLLAWTPGSLPPETERVLEQTRGVSDATTVYAALDWIRAYRAPERKWERVEPHGFALPFEVAAIEPREYARFVPRAERDLVASLSRGQMLLARTSAELRGAGRGLALDLGERGLLTTGVVSDAAANGYEALVARPLREWARADRFVLIHLRHASDRAATERVIQKLMPGQPLQTRTAGENPFLRYGDAVLPQLLVKATFGEFAAAPLASGNIDIDDAWERANIRSARVPLVGEVTCHKIFLPQLRGALAEIRDEGLGHAVHPQQYSGCYSPRHISHDPDGRLSHHSWGMAVDLNAHENTFGARPNMDRRIVEIFEGWGTTWGGRWIIPDGMHFEWIEFP